MIFQKLSNILDYYDKIQEYYDSLTSKFESFLSMKSASGQRTTMKDLIDQYAVGIESLEQLQQKYWSYQTGLTGFVERPSSEVYADLQQTLGSKALETTSRFLGAKYGEFYKDLVENNIDAVVQGVYEADADAFVNVMNRRRELEEKLQRYNDAVAERDRLKKEDLKEAKRNKDTTEVNRINKLLLPEQNDLIKENKLTGKDKKSIKALDNAITGWETILGQSSFYEEAYQKVVEYNDRLLKYNEYLDQKNNKEYWKSLSKEEQKELTQESKQNKLSSKELKDKAYLENLIGLYDARSQTRTESRLEIENGSLWEDLSYRRRNNENYKDSLRYAYEELNNAYSQEAIKEAQAKIKELKKEIKQPENKISAKELKLARYIEEQQAALDQLVETSFVDNLTAKTANYEELVRQIGAIQNKKKLSLNDQKNLTMYLEELNEINTGVMADDIVKFRNQYEKWWKLNEELKVKGSLSVEQNKSKKTLEDSMATMRQRYQDYIKGLQDELLDSLMVENPKTKEDLTQNYERTKKALEESYESQLKASEESYKNTSRYRDVYAQWEKQNQEIAKAEKKIEEYKAAGKSTKKLEQSIEKYKKARDKIQEKLDALARGATEENIANYLEAWNYVKNNEEAYTNNKLSQSAADTYDKYVRQLREWDDEKKDATTAIRQEMTDKLKELDIEYNKNLADMETEQHEKLEEMWQLAKQIAEWEATSLQSTIDQLDMMIQRYQALANMLANTNFESLKKFNGVMDLFGLDKAKSEIELIREQYEKAITMSNKKIQSSIDMANVYQKLLDAAKENDTEDPNNFKSILSEYYEAETTTDEMRKTMDSIIEMLNSNDYTANDWVTEWNDKMQEAVNSVIEAVDNIQTLKDELRENVIFKSINEAIEQLDSLNSRLSSMANVIQDNWVIVGDTLTEYGLAKINLLGQQMKNSQKEVEQWAKKVKEIDRIVDEEDQIAAYGSTHQYIVERNNALESYYNALQSVESTAYEIYQLGKQADEARVNSLRTVVDGYRSALNAKKEFYEYSKNIQSQTKDIEALQAQIEALNGVNTAEAKAQRAQLESQLADAQEKLEETQTEHLFSLEEKALDKFVSDLESTLNDANKSVKETFEEFAERLKYLLDSSASADVAKSLGNIFELLMGSDFIADLSGLVDKVIETGNKTEDSTETPSTTEEPTISEVQPQPSPEEVELIEDIEDAITDVSLGVSEVSDKQDEQYVQMNKLDYLGSLNIQASKLANVTQGLANNTSNIYSTMQKDITKQLSSIEKKLDNQAVNVTVRYDSLIRVNGAVDSMVVRDLERFSNDIVNRARDSIINDMRSVGYVSRVR